VIDCVARLPERGDELLDESSFILDNKDAHDVVISQPNLNTS
jgi:hypothetical protein